jgi:hypothetical protein
MNAEDLVSKSYRSIGAAWIAAAIGCAAMGRFSIALSVTLGTALGSAVLLTFDMVIRRSFTLEARRPRRAVLRLALLKYPLIVIILYCMVRWNRFDPIAFCGGIALVYLAILGTAVGVALAERRRSGVAPLAASSAPDGKEM